MVPSFSTSRRVFFSSPWIFNQLLSWHFHMFKTWFDKGLATKFTASDAELVPKNKLSGTYIEFQLADASDNILPSRFATPSSANCSITWACWVTKIRSSLSLLEKARQRSCHDSRKGNRLKSKRKNTHIISFSYNVNRYMLRAAWTTIAIKFGEMHTNILNLVSWNIWWPEWQMRRLPALLSAWLGGIVKLYQVRWSHHSTSIWTVSLTQETLVLKEITIAEKQNKQKRTQHNKESKTTRADQGGIEPPQKALVKGCGCFGKLYLVQVATGPLRYFQFATAWSGLCQKGPIYS